MFKTTSERLECEANILSSLLISGIEAHRSLPSRFSTTDFEDPLHREVFQSIQDLADLGEPINLLTVAKRIPMHALLLTELTKLNVVLGDRLQNEAMKLFVHRISDNNPWGKESRTRTTFARDARLNVTFVPDGFIRQYVEWASSTTDAPDEFHVTSCLAGLSGIIGDKLFLQWGGTRLFPAIWAVLLGKSSRLRKSTSIELMRRLLLQVPSDFVVDEEKVGEVFNLRKKGDAGERQRLTTHLSRSGYLHPSLFTLEGLLARLQFANCGLLTITEMAAFLHLCQKKYMAGTKETLTTIFDVPPIFSRFMRSARFVLQNPFVSILSASTLAWFESAIEEDDQQSGFLQRFIFSNIGSPTKPRMSICSPPDSEIEKSLVENLIHISSMRGELSLSRDAEEIYKEWIRFNEEESEKGNVDPHIEGFVQRLESYALKFGMIIEASWDNWIVSGRAMSAAVNMAQYYKENTLRLLNGQLAYSRVGKIKRRILEIVSAHHGICSWRDLNRAVGAGSKRERDDAIALLLDEGRITIETRTKTSGQSTRVVILGDD